VYVTTSGWERGELLGLDFPVHIDALRAAGPAFLTRAFRATGVVGADNSVAAITRLEPFTGGSTGRKAVLSITYAQPDAELPKDLFVKFSRDLDDEMRDRGKRQMESEVRFGLLSQIPDFPVAVPRCQFGEYRRESGSGILISERIAFGANGIEPHHAKGRDYEIEDPRAHYDALLTALARLAGTHRAGRFPADVLAHFEPRAPKVQARSRAPYTADDVRHRVARYADFAARYPQLLPASIRTDAFLDHLAKEAPRSVENAGALHAALKDTARGLFAFCHWNANIDNAWFWRDANGDLACGLLDWGNIGQLNMVTAISSCVVFTEPDFLIENLEHFFELFSKEFESAGGGPLDPDILQQQFALQMVAGGLQWPLDTVPLIERHIPDLDTVADRFDPRIEEDEFARTQLHLLTAYLMLWQASGPGELIDWAVRRSNDGPSAERMPASDA
jgi:hypothetical protein